MTKRDDDELVSTGLSGHPPAMTLRDWFAGQQLMRIASGWPNEDNMQLIAKNCYAMADAMLAERKK